MDLERVLEFFKWIMEINMKVNGEMISMMVLENIHLLMENFMNVDLKME